MLSAAAVGRVKAVLFVVLLLPLIPIVGGATRAADPAEHLTGETGEFAMRLLVLTLLVTPLRLASGWNWLSQVRRMIGLCAFFYAAAHFGVYFALDREFNFAAVLDDIVAERKFVAVGLAAFALLVPLALTSNNWSVKKLGGKAWAKLHKVVYAAAPLAAAHYLWLQLDDDLGEPLAYLGIFIVLLALRVPKVKAAVFRPFRRRRQ